MIERILTNRISNLFITEVTSIMMGLSIPLLYNYIFSDVQACHIKRQHTRRCATKQNKFETKKKTTLYYFFSTNLKNRRGHLHSQNQERN